ncbi:MAG: hypothetical protein AAF235_08485, partial [Planctomycetota bacterium]
MRCESIAGRLDTSGYACTGRALDPRDRQDAGRRALEAAVNRGRTMDVRTTRFGVIEIAEDRVIT